MSEIEKKNKTCQYEYRYRDYKCKRPLFDEEHCIFHSQDIEKYYTFGTLFWEEYKSQKEKQDELFFIGFIFPPEFDLRNDDLRGAELQEAKLFMAHLRGANLEGANLQWADLQGADLQRANLQRADFQEADLQRAKLQKADFQGTDFQGANLQGTDFQGANLQRVRFQGADLQEANLQWADLQGANLKETKLQGANLKYVKLQGAKLWKTKLQGANLLWADLHESDLHGVDLREADLRGVDLRGADLQGADLREADLQDANLQEANLKGASFEKAIVNNVKYDRSTLFRGIDVTQAKGSSAFVRFAKDQDFLEEMQSATWGKVKYHTWNIIADCGRSMFRWMFLSSLLAFLFAYKYILAYCDNPKSFIFASQPESVITFFYYSVVTFTTLGFGDVVPATESLKIWVMIEVVIGYVMLGGLISIFANKLARRS